MLRRPRNREASSEADGKGKVVTPRVVSMSQLYSQGARITELNRLDQRLSLSRPLDFVCKHIMSHPKIDEPDVSGGSNLLKERP